MKKKELKRRLKVTQEWLDKFMGAAAQETIRVLERDAEIAKLKTLLADSSFKCPWCTSVTFSSASELRMHEQECDSNRNKWQHDSEGLPAIMRELGISPIGPFNPLQWTNTVIHHIKELRHAARPVCVYCGASTTDTEAMRSHVMYEHDAIPMKHSNQVMCVRHGEIYNKEVHEVCGGCRRMEAFVAFLRVDPRR